MISAASSGGAGDIVYSIPVLHALNVSRLYVKDIQYNELGCTSQYHFVKRFVESQGIECVPILALEGFSNYQPGLVFDYDMDVFRQMPGRKTTHIIRNLCSFYDVQPPDFNVPWLKADTLEETFGTYDIINVTPRWRRNSRINWSKVISKHDDGVFCFMGSENDYHSFKDKYEAPVMVYHKAIDLLEILRYVRDCRRVFCNQNVTLTLAQGLCIPYFLEINPGRSNVRTYTKYETILNYQYYGK